MFKPHIQADDLFLNADAVFDCDILRNILLKNYIVANICINKRR